MAVSLPRSIWSAAFAAAGLASCVSPSGAAAAAPCDGETVQSVLERASSDRQAVVVDCDLTLPPVARVTKRLRVEGSEGSGVTIDCNGATVDSAGVPELAATNAEKDMILIRSVGGHSAWDRSWRRPVGVTVRNCNVLGAIRVLGMTDQEELKKSSYRAGHVRRMRRIAPTGTTFDSLTVTGRHRIPVYFGAGVTKSQLVNSELNGKSVATAIYVDAESSQTLIKKNYIHTVTPRELVALDSSRDNRLIDNRFSALNHGGIYLYRNCGEDGIVRHTTPIRNTIVNNVFYYNKYSPSPYSVRPAVFMGSRNGSPGYCGDDNGHPLGSGVSNLDYARENVVMQNQIYKLAVGLMIREGRSTDSPNFIKYNTTVRQPIPRLAGCYVPNGYYRDFLADGEGIMVFRRRDGTRYVTRRQVCRDGQLE